MVCFQYLFYFGLKVLLCEEKEERENCTFSLERIYESKENICTRYRVWITFLGEQGYRLTQLLLKRTREIGKGENSLSAFQRKISGHPTDTLPLSSI